MSQRGGGSGSVLERAFATAVSWPPLSRFTGWFSDRRLPSPILGALLRAYARAYRVDLSEAAEPVAAYRTFNAFFTRRLREGARPLGDGAGTVVSPSDSRLSRIGVIPEDGQLEEVKGRTYGLGALLGSAEDGQVFRRGLHATLYLSPAMYHRVHSPVEGRVVRWRYVPGRLFPVNGPAVRSVPGLFTRNERVVVFLETEDHGPVAVVLVGAANVGRIGLAFTDLLTNSGGPPIQVEAETPIPLARGAELGVFNLGSTVVLLLADEKLVPAGPAPGTLVRMGEALWRRP